MKTAQQLKKLAARYPRLIEWSDEDNCFIGSAPPLIGQCCHGDTEEDVAKQLAIIVLDLVNDAVEGKQSMPEPKKEFSGKFVVRISPSLHKKIALQGPVTG
jgi:predicted HicB family RNase H-like nuclease